MSETNDIRPFRIDIPQAYIDDLRDRLHRARYGAEIPGQGWSRGVPVDYLRGLATYWADGFDWRMQEARLNAHPRYLTDIDGQTFHLIHVRSDNPDATPLLITYDWPGSSVIFQKVIEPLSRDFHLVIPDLPGIHYSGPIAAPGWNSGKIADAFITLMDRLGYQRYGVQGSGGGGTLAVDIGRRAPDKVIGIHVNGHLTFPMGLDGEMDGLTGVEMERLGRLQAFRDDKMGFNHIQSTRPQTLAFGLHDSPVGQLAWVVEKFKEWTDTAADLPEDAVDRDVLLTLISLYWFTGTAGSAANLYYESAHDPSAFAPKERTDIPTGVALATTTDITIRRFAERDSNITHWTELERGGNFLALENPDGYVTDVRTFFASL